MKEIIVQYEGYDNKLETLQLEEGSKLIFQFDKEIWTAEQILMWQNLISENLKSGEILIIPKDIDIKVFKII
jgi:hypothetical protein